MFSSVTGNTRMLAEAIRETLPKENCDYFGVCGGAEAKSELLYVGFWTDKGNADADTPGLRVKNIFLFGTAGLCGSEACVRKVLYRVRQSVDASNTFIGEYMCQGRMPQAVKERYLRMKEQPEHPANLDMLIENFDRALPHPDAADLEKLRKAVAE